MEDKGPFYFPLKTEILDVAAGITKILSKLSVFRQYGNGQEYYRYLQLKFYDADSAKAAYVLISSFEEARAELGYGLSELIKRESSRLRFDPETVSPVQLTAQGNDGAEAGKILKVRYDAYVPEEYCKLAEDLLHTRLHFLPISPELVASLKNFLRVYSSLEIIRLLPFSFYPPTNAYNDEDIALLHGSLTTLARQILPILLAQPPVHIQISGDTTKMTVSVDGSPKKLSLTETTGIAALALLPYNRWFPYEDFQRLVIPKPENFNARDFGTALDIFKNEHPPFGWDPDGILRRVNGVIIESLVDEVVLRAYLAERIKEKLKKEALKRKA